ncbi:MAG: CvpA family protein [Eubacteriales bacterium]|nr:CvpA family protein [Eubacteriales bacterium]
MNIFDIIILAILGVSLISGMYKGFLASGLTIIGFIAAWVGAMHFYPQLSAAIQSNASIMEMLQYYLEADALFESSAAGAKLASAVSQTELAQTISTLPLPAIITDAFRENVLAQSFASLDLTTLAEYLGQTICGAAINVLSFLAMFIVSYVVVLLLVNLLNHVFRFPVLRHLDWLLGGAFGLVRGAVVTALLFSMAPMILSMLPLEITEELIGSSVFYDFFSRNNILETLVQSVF